MKPGIKSTEFWVALAVAVIGLLMTMNVLPSTFPQSETIAAVEIIAGAVIAILVALGYIKARTTAKLNGNKKDGEK